MMIQKLLKQMSGTGLSENKEHAMQLIKATKGSPFYVPFSGSMIKGRKMQSHMQKKLTKAGRPDKGLPAPKPPVGRRP